MSLVFINDSFVEEAFAKVSICDRGFKFGDGLFETIPFFHRKAFKLSYHLERLKNGVSAINIRLADINLSQIIDDLIQKNSVENGFVRVFITRGYGSKGYLPTYESPPTIIAEILERSSFISAKSFVEAARLVISPYKKIPLECLPSNYKLMNGLNYGLAREDAVKRGFFDAVMLTQNEKISECSSANIFWIKKDKLFTPSLKTAVVAGVTRRVIQEISPFEVIEGEFNYLKISGADEVFITNVNIGVLPVRLIEPCIFKNNKNFEKTGIIRKKYLEQIYKETGFVHEQF